MTRRVDLLRIRAYVCGRGFTTMANARRYPTGGGTHHSRQGSTMKGRRRETSPLTTTRAGSSTRPRTERNSSSCWGLHQVRMGVSEKRRIE